MVPPASGFLDRPFPDRPRLILWGGHRHLLHPEFCRTPWEVKATRGSRFLLSRQKSAIYTAELLDANLTWDYGVSADDVRAAFSLIAAEWTAGDN